MAFKRSSNSAGGLQAAFDSGTPAQKAAFQASVSGAGKNKTKLALIGCSFEAYNGLQTLPGNIFSYHQTGYVTWANIALGGVLRVDQYGIDGQNTAQVCDRVDAALAATTARFVLLGGGMENDQIAVSAFTVSAAVVRAESDFLLLTAAYLKVIADPSRVLITRTCSARGGTVSDAQKAYQSTISARVRTWSLANGVPCLDIAAITTNPSTGAGLLSGEYGALDNATQADNTHMSFEMTQHTGRALAAILRPLIAPGVVGFAGGARDAYSATLVAGNIAKNGKMLGTTGTSTCGPLATNWTESAPVAPAGGSVTYSKVPDSRTFSRGEWQQIAIVGATAGAVRHSQSGAFPAELVGRTGLTMSVEIQTDAAGWGNGNTVRTLPSVTLDFYTGAWGLIRIYSILSTTAANPFSRPEDGVLFMDGIDVPADAVNYILSFRFFGVGTIRYTNLQIRA